jgi:hypothetical protein
MAGLVRRVPRRKVGPRRTSSQDPHDSVEDVAHGPERASPLRGRPLELLGGEEVLDRSPLLVGEVHGQGRSEIPPTVDPHRFSDRVPCTYAGAVMRCSLVKPVRSRQSTPQRSRGPRVTAKLIVAAGQHAREFAGAIRRPGCAGPLCERTSLLAGSRGRPLTPAPRADDRLGRARRQPWSVSRTARTHHAPR